MLTRHIKNPIVLARKIMENTPHVMLIGEGAERFAKQHNLIFVDNGTVQRLQNIKGHNLQKREESEM
jgi:beta-aspartyl-peptidase (threonine type)